MSNPANYVIVTPARNEARFIGLTIESVLAQTIRPLKWVIVSDGSTDGTDDIVLRYAAGHSWIELIRTPDRAERDFAGKVHAFKAGYASVQDIDYGAIACLDGDISFDTEYFSFLIRKLVDDPELGLVGTPFKETGSGAVYDYRFTSIEHVSGACQFFRRKCFEDIGGYVPVKSGNIDHIAVITARMRGWKTRTFTEKICMHHREIGTAQRNVLASRFHNGVKDYCIGNHPFWELCRTFYQMRQWPVVLGGLMIGSGYLWASVKRVPRSVSPEAMRFYRGEQRKRLKALGSLLRKSPRRAPLIPAP